MPVKETPYKWRVHHRVIRRTAGDYVLNVSLIDYNNERVWTASRESNTPDVIEFDGSQGLVFPGSAWNAIPAEVVAEFFLRIYETPLDKEVNRGEYNPSITGNYNSNKRVSY